MEELTQVLSQFTNNSLIDSPPDDPSADLSGLGDELPFESPAQVPEGEAEGSSELNSKLLLDLLAHGEMANRLGCAKSTLSNAKNQSDFPQWSKERDPDAIAWTWNPRAKVFVPVADVPAPKRTMPSTLREELIEVQDQASLDEVLDFELLVQRLRRAGLNDAKIVPIINKLFPPPAGHKNWTKSLLPNKVGTLVARERNYWQ